MTDFNNAAPACVGLMSRLVVDCLLVSSFEVGWDFSIGLTIERDIMFI